MYASGCRVVECGRSSGCGRRYSCWTDKCSRPLRASGMRRLTLSSTSRCQLRRRPATMAHLLTHSGTVDRLSKWPSEQKDSGHFDHPRPAYCRGWEWKECTMIDPLAACDSPLTPTFHSPHLPPFLSGQGRHSTHSFLLVAASRSVTVDWRVYYGSTAQPPPRRPR